MAEVIELMPNRVEVWSAVVKGETEKTWFVSVWEDGYEFVAYDGPTEEGAREAATGWDLPIMIRR